MARHMLMGDREPAMGGGEAREERGGAAYCAHGTGGQSHLWCGFRLVQLTLTLCLLPPPLSSLHPLGVHVVWVSRVEGEYPK